MLLKKKVSRAMTTALLAAGSIAAGDALALPSLLPCVAGQVYTTSQFCVIPAGVTAISAQVWGGGGGGGDGQYDGGEGNGGGGGAFCGATFNIVGGETLNLIVGQAGAGGIAFSNATSGGNSILSWNSNEIVVAGGGGRGAINSQGAGGICGSFGAGATSPISFAGGSGGWGGFSGAGGGASGSPTAAGGSGGNGSWLGPGDSDAAGGSGGTGASGSGAGGSGGAGTLLSPSPGVPGSGPGGGGGGGGRSEGTFAVGGSGAAGRIVLNFAVPSTTPVPALGMWASLLLAGSLVLAAGVHLRRRRS